MTEKLKRKPRLGCALIIRDDNGRVLLARRAKKPFEGFWILPGGGIDFLEPYTETAKREAMEELSIEISDVEFFCLKEIISPPDEHRVIVYCTAQHSGGEVTAGSDVSEALFLTREQLAAEADGDFVTPTVKSVIWEYLNFEK